MHTLSPSQVADATSKAAAGDLSACDVLGTYFYSVGRYEEAAEMYLRAIQGNFYEHNSRPESESHFFGMINRGLIPKTSHAVQFVEERERVRADVTARVNKAAGAVCVAVFLGYLVLVYAGGVTGLLREYSLIIAGGLSWLAWVLVLSSFNK